ARQIGSGRVQRYFLRVPKGGVTLHATVALPNPDHQRATVRLYEPSGQPFRDADEIPLGQRDPPMTQIVVRSEDIVPGVYELDVFPPPLGDATATVSAELAPVTLDESGDGLEVANRGARTVTGRMSM